MPANEAALWLGLGMTILAALGLLLRRVQDIVNRFDAIGPNGERINRLEQGQSEMKSDIAEIKEAIIPEHGKSLAANDEDVRIELRELTTKLDAHTLQDTANFAALEGKLDLLLRREDRRNHWEDD